MATHCQALLLVAKAVLAASEKGKVFSSSVPGVSTDLAHPPEMWLTQKPPGYRHPTPDMTSKT